MHGRTLIAAAAALAFAVAPASASDAGDARGLLAAGPDLVLDANSAVLVGEGRRALRLKKVAPDVTTIHAGDEAPEINVTTRELVDGWAALGFAATPPTATVEPERGEKLTVTLRRPRFDGRKLTFGVERVADAARGDRPARLGFTNLSIDASGADQAVLDAMHDRPAGDPPGFWVGFSTYVDAWGGDGDCRGDTWGADRGECYGKFDRGGTSPYDGNHGSTGYFGWEDGTTKLWLDAGRNKFQQGGLNGRAPSRNSAEFYVNDNSWIWEQTNFKVQSGSDASKLGQQGGPIGIDVEHHSAGPFTNSGYTMEAKGWLWCVPPRGDCSR